MKSIIEFIIAMVFFALVMLLILWPEIARNAADGRMSPLAYALIILHLWAQSWLSWSTPKKEQK